MNLTELLHKQDPDQLSTLYQLSLEQPRVMYEFLEVCSAEDKVLVLDGDLSIHLDVFLHALSKIFYVPTLTNFIPYELIHEELSMYEHIIYMQTEHVVVFDRIGFYAAVFDIARRHYLDPKVQIVMEYIREAYRDLDAALLCLPSYQEVYVHLVDNADSITWVDDKCYDLHFTFISHDVEFTFQGVDKLLNVFKLLELLSSSDIDADVLTMEQLKADYTPSHFDGLSFTQVQGLFEKQQQASQHDINPPF